MSGIDVFRRGKEQETRDRHRIANAEVHPEFDAVGFWFETDRGKGDSHYELYVRSKAFEALAQAMIRSNPEAAIKAFGAALRDGVPQPFKETIWSPYGSASVYSNPIFNEARMG